MAVPTLVRSGRGASATTVSIDVTGGRTLFIYGTINSGVITNNRAAGVTNLCYDGTQRRVSVWNIAAGTTGSVTFTATAARLWAYCIVDWPAAQGVGGYTASNTTSAMATVSMTTYTSAQHAAFYATNNSADWGATPAGYTDIEKRTDQPVDASWYLSVSTAAQAPGSYTSPAMDRGKNGTARIEGVGFVTLIPATLKTSTLVDAFDTEISPVTWPTLLRYGTVAWDAGRAAISERSAAYSGVATDAIFDLNMSAIYTKITPVPIMTKSTEITLGVRDLSNVNGMFFIAYNDSGVTPTVCMRLRSASVNDNYFAAYNATVNPWVRMRKDATNVYWDVSPDGTNWTNLKTLATTLSLSTLQVELSVGQYSAEPQQGTAYFDNLNMVPAVAGLGSPKVWTGSAYVAKVSRVWTGTAWVQKPWKRWTGTAWVLLGEAAPWTPATIPGLGLWLEADKITGLSDGAGVTLWPDASGLGHHATPIAAVPQWRVAGMNGKPTVKFTNSRMFVAGWATALAGKTEYTLFQVLSQIDFSYPVITTAPVYTSWHWLTEFNVDRGIYWGHGNGNYLLYPANMVSGQPTLLTYSLAAGAPKLFKNGAEVTSPALQGTGVSTAVLPIGEDVILGGYYEGSYPLDDHVAAMIWYDHYLIDSERIQVENYLKTKYGIA